MKGEKEATELYDGHGRGFLRDDSGRPCPQSACGPNGILVSVRVASLSPAATEILFALGMQSQIVCVDRFSNWPDAAAELPHLRDHQKLRSEDLMPFAPKVVLTGTAVQERLAAELRQAGLAVVHQDPRTLAEAEEAIRQLGALFGAES